MLNMLRARYICSIHPYLYVFFFLWFFISWFPSRGQENHGFLTEKGGSSMAYWARVMAMVWGRAHALAFSHMLIMLLLAIFCILLYIFLLNGVIYACNFLFRYFNLWGIDQSLTQGGFKGMWRLTLCGPSEAMLAQVVDMMNWFVLSGRGVI